MDDRRQEAFDNDGILVGWYGTMANAMGAPIRIFIPRRDEDIKQDRAAIAALIERAQPRNRKRKTKR